ncbi:MAG: lipopolysaccharide biosynthesis protein [Gammaproteobacteria bacterium]|nr:MAG: lipopolysaccharide biosynthesis protein [Gammaproteobacteria bacterium]
MYSKLNKRQLLGRLYGNAFIYGVGIVLVRAGGILLLPIYWLKLSPTDYGIIGLSQAITVFLGPVLGMGLYDAVQRFYYEWKEGERPRYLAALWSFTLFASFVLCVLLDAVGASLFGQIYSQVPFEPYLRIAVWTAFATNISMIPLVLLRVRERLKPYTLIVAGQFLTQTAITLYFVFVLDWGAEGYLTGLLVNASLWGVIFALSMLREMRFPVTAMHLREPFRYAFPIIPTSLLDGLNSVVDRYFLDKYVGLQQIGHYTLANQFGLGFNMFNQVMKNSWFPFLYRISAERADGPVVLSRFPLYYIAALSLPALGIALLTKDLIVWFGDEKYFDLYEYVPAFVLFYFLFVVGNAMGRGLDLAKRMGPTPFIQLAGLATSVGLMWLLVPRYGIWAVIGALIAGTTVRVGLLIVLSHRVYPRPVHGRRLLLLAVIVGGAYFAGSAVDSGYLLFDVLLKTLMVLICGVALVWFVLDRKPALALAGNVLRSLKAKI